jgi:hypothetical protein
MLVIDGFPKLHGNGSSVPNMQLSSLLCSESHDGLSAAITKPCFGRSACDVQTACRTES